MTSWNEKGRMELRVGILLWDCFICGLIWKKGEIFLPFPTIHRACGKEKFMDPWENPLHPHRRNSFPIPHPSHCEAIPPSPALFQGMGNRIFTGWVWEEEGGIRDVFVCAPISSGISRNPLGKILIPYWKGGIKGPKELSLPGAVAHHEQFIN